MCVCVCGVAICRLAPGRLQALLAAAAEHATSVARPHLIVYVGGGDVLAGGGARLAVDGDALLRRDALVYRFARHFAAPLAHVVCASAAPAADALVAQSIVNLHAVFRL